MKPPHIEHGDSDISILRGSPLTHWVNDQALLMPCKIPLLFMVKRDHGLIQSHAQR